MRYTEKNKYLFFILIPATFLLLLLLIGFQSLPIVPLSVEAMHNIVLQQARSQSLAKNVLIIEYITNDQYTRSQAIGDLQVGLPAFEQGQATISNYHDTDVASAVQQSRSDYLEIDVAARLILASVNNNKPVDKNQASIILARSHSYNGTMSQVALVLQQVVSDAAQRLFLIKAVIGFVIMVLLILWVLAMRSMWKAVQEEHRELTGPLPISNNVNNSAEMPPSVP